MQANGKKSPIHVKGKVAGRKMTDKKWHEIIIKCKAACDEHLRLLKIAEEEYFKRYGNAPSELNDDWWIDTLHYGIGSTDLDLIKKSAEIRRCPPRTPR